MSTVSRRNLARYAPLLMQAQATEQRAQIALAAARQRLHKEEQKLEQLQSYASPASADRFPSRPGMLANRQAFMTQLKQAVALQSQNIRRLQAAEHAACQQWKSAHQQTERYEKLIANQQAEQRAAQARREQRELDEMALRRHGQLQCQPGH